MSIFKPLSYYIRRYEGIFDHVRNGHTKSLLDAKSQLEALDREYNDDNSRSPDRFVLADLTEPNQTKRWTCGDGKAIEVGSMTDSHLFYALAKAGRGEYPDTYSRQTGVRALKIEAFRRLRNELTTATNVAAPRAFSCDWCCGKTQHQTHCPTN